MDNPYNRFTDTQCELTYLLCILNMISCIYTSYKGILHMLLCYIDISQKIDDVNNYNII